MVIHYKSREELEAKFGVDNAEKYYAGRMIQLSGPWAPHIAIHATPDESKIGLRKSNGCIQVTPSDYDWLYENVGVGSKVPCVYE